MATAGDKESVLARFTLKQGQYLAFIALYTKLHRQAPLEQDIQRYFRVTPPTVHCMILTLERLGLIRRTSRRPRSVVVLVPPHELPELL